MSSTSILVSFDVNDLDAQYKIIGSSPNYSFEHNLGIGEDLVDSLSDEDKTFSKVIPLRGNYGEFDIKVFAVSNVGIKSESLSTTVVVNPPVFEGSFTFNNLSISDGGVEETLEIIEVPESPGDKFVAQQNFVGNDIQIAWELIPPNGHALEGQSVSTKLLDDPYFSHFELRLKNNQSYLPLSQLDNSVAMESTLMTTDVSIELNNYRNFSINLNAGFFEELNIDRTMGLEIVCYDILGQTTTGLITGYNPQPIIENFIQNNIGAENNFSWIISDSDFTNVDVNVLTIPSGAELFNSGNLIESLEYIERINSLIDKNRLWDSTNNVSYKAGDMVSWQGNVYQAKQGHVSNLNLSPSNVDYWKNLGGKISYEYKQESIIDTAFSNTQVWGYKNYYTFQAFDDFGPGDLMLLAEDGELVKQGSPGATLFPYQSIVKIADLRSFEDQDDFVFRWSVVDQDNDLVDLEQYKYIFSDSSLPSVLGLSGSLFDTTSKEYIMDITSSDANKGIGLTRSEDGEVFITTDVPQTKIFDTYTFTRELNNQIYGSEGFPDYEEYDSTKNYQAENHVSVENVLYQSKIDQNVEFLVKPVYSSWDRQDELYPDDCVEFNGSIYKATNSFGPSATEGFFDFETNYNVGDLVVSLTENINFYKFYGSQLEFSVVSVDSDGGITTNIENIVDGTFAGLSVIIGDETKQIVDYLGSTKTLKLESSFDSVSANDVGIISGFTYSQADIVYHNGKIYRCLQDQQGDSIVEPDGDSEYWDQLSFFSQIDCDIYEKKYANNFVPGNYYLSENLEVSTVDGSENLEYKWEPQNPFVSSRFNLYIQGLESYPNWEDINNYFSGDIVYHEQDLWRCLAVDGTRIESQIVDGELEISYIEPGTDSDFWVNTDEAGGDITLKLDNQEISIGDTVYYNGYTYSAKNDSPADYPILGINSLNSDSDLNWQVYWEEQDQYSDFVFGYVATPQKGKRSIGIELGIVDSQGRIFSKVRKEAYNLAPTIQSYSVDSLGGPPRVDFTVNYSLANYEKTTKLHLYRGKYEDGNDFSILNEDGTAISEPGENSPLVKIFYAKGDEIIGENITENIIDIPELEKVNGIEVPGTFYYKMLPFDHFGSGVLFHIDDPIRSFPKGYHSKDPNAPIGPIYRTAKDDIPGPVKDFGGTAAFQNYFLNWSHPNSEISQDFDYNENIPLDISHYEVWSSSDKRLMFGALSETNGVPVYLKNISNKNIEIDYSNNKGYRRIEGDITSTGPPPIEQTDPAAAITNAKRIFNVSANGKEMEVVHNGETNETKYFWIRAVDKAGNKSPFTGQANLEGDIHEILGLKLTLGQITSTDVSNFELNMTEKFTNTVALIPNNPFKNLGDGSIAWDQHILFNQGTGYIVNASAEEGTSDGFVWWDKNDENGNLNLNSYIVRWENLINGQVQEEAWELVNPQNRENLREFETESGSELKAIYFSGINYQTSAEHPANIVNPENPDEISVDDVVQPGFDDGDFIIARNTNGVPTVSNHAFANALIGSASIDKAAIISAHVNDLSADKITAGEIKGHKIEISHSVEEDSATETLSEDISADKYGSISSKGFDGIDLLNDKKGFVLSGDGSFAFQSGTSALMFDDEAVDGEGGLVLYGKLRAKPGIDLDFIDLDASPAYFRYTESEEGIELEDPSAQCILDYVFRSSSVVNANEVLVRMSVTASVTDEEIDLFEYCSVSVLGDLVDSYGLSFVSFEEVIAGSSVRGSLSLSANGFDRAIKRTLGSSALDVNDSVNIYIKSAKSDFYKKISVARVVDGKPAEIVRLICNPQACFLNKYLEEKDTWITLTANIQASSQPLRWSTPDGEPKIYLAQNDQDRDNIQEGNEPNQPQTVYIKSEDFIDKTKTNAKGDTYNEIIHQSVTVTVSTQDYYDEDGNLISSGHSDEYTIPVLADGADTLSVLMSNPKHVLHFDEKYSYPNKQFPTGLEDDTTEYDGSGTDIDVYEGSTKFYFAGTIDSETGYAAPNDSDLKPKEFKVQAVEISKFEGEEEILNIDSTDHRYVGLARLERTAEGGCEVPKYSYVHQDAKNISVTYKIVAKKINGELVNFDAIQQLSVSERGNSSKSVMLHFDSPFFVQKKYHDNSENSTENGITPNEIVASVERNNINVNDKIKWSAWKENPLESDGTFKDNLDTELEITDDVLGKNTAEDQNVAIGDEQVKITSDKFISNGKQDIYVVVQVGPVNDSGDGLTDVIAFDLGLVSMVKEGSDVIKLDIENFAASIEEKYVNGDFSYSSDNSSNKIRVFQGTNELDAVSTEGDLGPGKFYMGTPVVDPQGLSVTQFRLSDDGKSFEHANIAIDKNNYQPNSSGGYVTYTAEYQDSKGEGGTISAVMTLSVSRQGRLGVSPTYRGDWDRNFEKRMNGEFQNTLGVPYVYLESTQVEPGRGDIIRKGNDFYICGKSHIVDYDPDAPENGTLIDQSNPERWQFKNAVDAWNKLGAESTENKYWNSFEAAFESVATNLLLADVAHITEGMIVGDDSESGYIRSNGFVGGLVDLTKTSRPLLTTGSQDYSTPGFLLYFDSTASDGQGDVYFDMGASDGAIDSFIRFSSDENLNSRITIKGVDIRNSADLAYKEIYHDKLGGWITPGLLVSEIGQADNWQNSARYLPGDLVYHNNQTWRCLQDTSSTFVEPGNNSSYWTNTDEDGNVYTDRSSTDITSLPQLSGDQPGLNLNHISISDAFGIEYTLIGAFAPGDRIRWNSGNSPIYRTIASANKSGTRYVFTTGEVVCGFTTTAINGFGDKNEGKGDSADYEEDGNTLNKNLHFWNTYDSRDMKVSGSWEAIEFGSPRNVDVFESVEEVHWYLREKGYYKYTHGINDKIGNSGSFIGGGFDNYIINSDSGVNIFDCSIASGIGSGAQNTVNAKYTFIGGGFENLCEGNFSSINSGYLNKIINDPDSNGEDIFKNIEHSQGIFAGRNNIIRGSQVKINPILNWGGVFRIDPYYGKNDMSVDFGDMDSTGIVYRNSWFTAMKYDSDGVLIDAWEADVTISYDELLGKIDSSSGVVSSIDTLNSDIFSDIEIQSTSPSALDGSYVHKNSWGATTAGWQFLRNIYIVFEKKLINPGGTDSEIWLARQSNMAELANGIESGWPENMVGTWESLDLGFSSNVGILDRITSTTFSLTFDREGFRDDDGKIYGMILEKLDSTNDNVGDPYLILHGSSGNSTVQYWITTTAITGTQIQLQGLFEQT